MVDGPWRLRTRRMARRLSGSWSTLMMAWLLTKAGVETLESNRRIVKGLLANHWEASPLKHKQENRCKRRVSGGQTIARDASVFCEHPWMRMSWFAAASAAVGGWCRRSSAPDTGRFPTLLIQSGSD